MDQFTQPDFSRCAVLIIDMQNDFVLPDAPAEIPGTNKIIPRIKRILTGCRLFNIPVFHVIRLYLPDGSNADLCRKEFIQSGAGIVKPGEKGAEIVSELQPEDAAPVNFDALLKGKIQAVAEKEWILYKPRWSAFYQTQLEKFLKEKGINTLIFTGCNFPNCPRTSIYEASERDFKIVMVKDAVSGIYDKGTEEIKQIGGAVVSADELINILKSRFSKR